VHHFGLFLITFIYSLGHFTLPFTCILSRIINSNPLLLFLLDPFGSIERSFLLVLSSLLEDLPSSTHHTTYHNSLTTTYYSEYNNNGIIILNFNYNFLQLYVDLYKDLNLLFYLEIVLLIYLNNIITYK